MRRRGQGGWTNWDRRARWRARWLAMGGDAWRAKDAQREELSEARGELRGTYLTT
jgi:hypothetical protein